MSQLVSAESKYRSGILKHWDSDRDLYQHVENEGDKIELGVFPYEHSRALDEHTAEQAHKYIRELTKEYPFQLRFAMALPLWERFAEEYCTTGDERKALGAI